MPLASIDLSPFTGMVTALLSGGVVYAWAIFRRTPVEVESISVATLRGVIEELREELKRKDDQLAAQNRMIGTQQQRIGKLEKAVAELQGAG